MRRIRFSKFHKLEFEWSPDFKTQISWSAWRRRQNNTLKKCKRPVRVNRDRSTLKQSHPESKEKQAWRKRWVLERSTRSNFILKNEYISLSRTFWFMMMLTPWRNLHVSWDRWERISYHQRKIMKMCKKAKLWLRLSEPTRFYQIKETRFQQKLNFPNPNNPKRRFCRIYHRLLRLKNEKSSREIRA